MNTFNTGTGEAAQQNSSMSKKIATKFTQRQVDMLEDKFKENTSPDINERRSLGAHIGLSEDQVGRWFQRRRKKQIMRNPVSSFTPKIDLPGEGEGEVVWAERFMSQAKISKTFLIDFFHHPAVRGDSKATVVSHAINLLKLDSSKLAALKVYASSAAYLTLSAAYDRSVNSAVKGGKIRKPTGFTTVPGRMETEEEIEERILFESIAEALPKLRNLYRNDPNVTGAKADGWAEVLDITTPSHPTGIIHKWLAWKRSKPVEEASSSLTLSMSRLERSPTPRDDHYLPTPLSASPPMVRDHEIVSSVKVKSSPITPPTPLLGLGHPSSPAFKLPSPENLCANEPHQSTEPRVSAPPPSLSLNADAEHVVSRNPTPMASGTPVASSSSPVRRSPPKVSSPPYQRPPTAVSSRSSLLPDNTSATRPGTPMNGALSLQNFARARQNNPNPDNQNSVLITTEEYLAQFEAIGSQSRKILDRMALFEDGPSPD